MKTNEPFAYNKKPLRVTVLKNRPVSFTKPIKRVNQFLIVIVAISLFLPVSAQVGINNEHPDSCALLHIGEDNDKKGLLIPFIKEINMVDTENLMESLLFYSPHKKSFLFWDGTEWQKVNPFIARAPEENISTEKNITAVKESEDEGHKYHIHDSLKTRGVPTIPIGGIVMWSGSPENLPANWKLCNGEGDYYNPLSNTSIPVPDLQGRFIVGYDPADSDYDAIGKKGPPANDQIYELEQHGAKIQLKNASMPQHNHPVIDEGHTHEHNLRTDTIRHQSWNMVLDKKKIDEYCDGPVMSKKPGNNTLYAHKHAFDGNVLRNTANVDIDYSGTGNAHENRPPYYVLAYIIRIW